MPIEFAKWLEEQLAMRNVIHNNRNKLLCTVSGQALFRKWFPIIMHEGDIPTKTQRLGQMNTPVIHDAVLMLTLIRERQISQAEFSLATQEQAQHTKDAILTLSLITRCVFCPNGRYMCTKDQESTDLAYSML